MKDRDLKTVLIIEGNWHGHRLMYVALLAEAAQQMGAKVVVALSDSANGTPEFRDYCSGLRGAVAIREERRLSIGDIARISAEESAGLVIVPSGDRIAQYVGLVGVWRGPGELVLLIMRAQRQESRHSVLAWSIKRRLLARARAVAGVRLVNLVSALDAAPHSPASAPDPVTLCASVEDVRAVRDDWGLDSNRYWFAVMGAVSGRKNLDVVLSALEVSGAENIGILIAGQVASDVMRRVQPALQRLSELGMLVRVHNRFLTTTEFDAAVVVVDCVVVAHDNEGPSGVLAKAARAGTRVITAGASSLRRDAELCPDVVSWSETSTAGLAAQFRQAQTAPRPMPLASLSVEAFCRALLQ